jgi:hypothetical protein
MPEPMSRTWGWSAASNAPLPLKAISSL